ncbi:MAG: magnesium transporter [Lachnospiraceae bacterium]|nr:magnesium transporter [Lachnospiraceae bacterium]
MSDMEQDVRTAPEEQEADVMDELKDLIRSDLPFAELRTELDDYHDADIARVLTELDKPERVQLYRLLGDERISDVFSYLDVEDVEAYFQELGVERSADILEEMDADDAVDVLESLPEEYREQLVDAMDEEAVEDIRLITSYEDDEIGSKMTTNYIAIRRGLGIKDAMRELTRQSAENDNIMTLYVVEDDEETYYGAIDLKDLIIARKEVDLESIISTSYPHVYGHDKIADEIERIRDYNEDSIPVLDDQNHLIGVLTPYDVVEVIDDELGDDYAKLAGLTSEEDLREPLLESIKKRMPWLAVLLVLGLVVSTVVGLFEGVVREIAIVVAFQSLILDMAGNSGTQSLAVTIRVLMDEHLTGRDKAGFVFKEARVGFCNGAILGICAFGLVGLYIAFLKGFPLHQAFIISGCVGISLWCATIIASCMGTLIPMLLHRLHVDPAVASGPLITTTNDLIAVVTYYGLCWLLLLQVMHING